MKRVYSSLNSLLVDNLYNVLEQEGIECEIRNRHGGSIVGEIPVSEAFVELWVDDQSEALACERIEAALSATEAGSGETWRCDKCGRDIDAQFDTCWFCAKDGSDRDRPTDQHPILVTTESYLAVAGRYRWFLLVGALLLLSAWVFRTP